MNNILSRHTDPNKVFIINRSEIDGRIDPEFYNPEYKIPDSKIFTKIRKITTQIIHPPEYPREFSDDGFQLIRSQNVRPLGLTLHENPVFFSAEFLEKKKYSLAKKGDVLVVRSGVNAGDVAVVDNNYANVIIGADTLLCRCSEDVIPKFLQVYFFTDFGKRQITKNTTGATNKHLNSENLGKVFIPILDIKIQNKCIGIFEEALDTSGQKEAKAQELLASIDDYLLAELGITFPEKDNSLQSRTFTTQYKEIMDGRIDPEYQRINYKKQVDAILNSNYPLLDLKNATELITNGKTPAREQYSNSETPYPLIKVSSYSNDYIDLSKCGYAKERQYLKVRKGDIFILSAAHQAEYVGRHIKFLDEEPKIDTSFVGELICLRPKNDCDPLFIFSLFQTKIYKDLINREKTGQTSHVYGKDLRFLKIPDVSLEKQTEIANHIANIRSQAKQLQQEAQDILEQAKKEVEKIILG
jgi:type I restriction enzyme M protein